MNSPPVVIRQAGEGVHGAGQHHFVACREVTLQGLGGGQGILLAGIEEHGPLQYVLGQPTAEEADDGPQGFELLEAGCGETPALIQLDQRWQQSVDGFGGRHGIERCRPGVDGTR